jgi:hypothetical protein
MTVLNFGQLQGISPTNEIELSSDTKLKILGNFRITTLQNSSGLQVMSLDSAGTATLSGNLTVGNNTITCSKMTSTGRMIVPVWTTATRPASAVARVGFNTTLSKLEIYNGAQWVSLPSS